jgi:deoxycytidylate deaminase
MTSNSNLDQLYSLRRNFTILAVTGRTGSGCSKISNILSRDFDVGQLGYQTSENKTIQTQKRLLVYNFCVANWKNYKVIEYKKVLLFLLLPDLLNNEQNTLLFDFFRYRLADEPNLENIQQLKSTIQNLILQKRDLIKRIKETRITKDGHESNNKSNVRLKEIGEIFWGNEFNQLATIINDKLFEAGFIERKMLLHHIANNYRKSGKPFKTDIVNSGHIFHIAKAINKLIKATRATSNGTCHIVIDSIKNSLEINFFRERYSAFYVIAVKNDNRHNEISNKYNTDSQVDIDRLLQMDDQEYSAADYTKGDFYSPDLQNCIQISDYHVNVRDCQASLREANTIENAQSRHETFYSVDEQIMKLQALIQQPNLITPEPVERVMQLAFTAKLNSGCISRQVGAAVTDKDFSIKAIGWNDVPKGSVPCSIRNVKEINSCGFGFTQFELGKGIKETENINPSIPNKETEPESIEFNKFVETNFSEENYPTEALNGRNCPYCFKSAYNTFKGEKNQVHTRSLHAEENAILQISKFGGQALNGGYLFTTASTCELCAKKAYQLGVRTIFYIDPYPGISRSHILQSNPKTDPKMELFQGAVGHAYLKFYEPFMSQKDELAMMSGHEMHEPEKVTKLKLRSILRDVLDESTQKELDKILQGNDVKSAEIIGKLIKKGLQDGEY